MRVPHVRSGSTTSGIFTRLHRNIRTLAAGPRSSAFSPGSIGTRSPDYQAVLERFPTHTIAGNNLAWLLVRDLDDGDQALAVAERLRGNKRAEVLHPNLVVTLTRIYREAGRLTEGRQLLTRAMQLHPERANLQLEAGLIYIAENDREVAQQHLQRALSLGLDPAEADEARLWIRKIADRAQEQG